MNKHILDLMRAAGSPDEYIRYAEAHGMGQDERELVEMLSK